MACVKCVSLASGWKTLQASCQVTGVRWFQTSVPAAIGGKWREQQGMASNNSKYGPLTDLPDYSYLDGRPTPLNKGQKFRRLQRIGVAKRIKFLTDEMFSAREEYATRQEETEGERQRVINNKLKPKPTS